MVIYFLAVKQKENDCFVLLTSYLIDCRNFNYWKETLEQRVYLFIYFTHHIAITSVSKKQTFQSLKAVAAKSM